MKDFEIEADTESGGGGRGGGLGARWAGIWRAGADLVFPPGCVHCGGVVESSGRRHLCRRCAPLITPVRAPHCSVCGHPFFGKVAGERICVHCEGLRPAFRAGRTAVLLKGPARSLVHELKYHHGLHVLEDMEAIFRENAELMDWVRGAVLVPVPLHPRKERERGYNQGRLIAETLARAAGGETKVAAWLRRVADTKTQTFFDRETRRANLKNAFALAPGAGITTDLHTLLVDDVFTTGSTLNACAQVLQRAGCLNLDVVTFGHG